MIKRFLISALALCLLLSLAGCGKTEEEVSYVVRIGVFEPLTGSGAARGAAELIGIRYAQSVSPKVRIAGHDYTVELAVQDNGGAAAFAPVAAEALLSSGVSLVLGSYGDDVARAGGAVFGANGVAVVGVTNTAPDLTENNDYFFRVASTSEVQADALGRYAAGQLGASVAYCVGEGASASAQRQLAAFSSAFEQEGGAAQSEYLAETPDLIACLLRADGIKAKVIFAPIPAQYVSQMISLARSLEIAIPIIGTDILDDDLLLETPANVDPDQTWTDTDVYASAMYVKGVSKKFDEGLRAFTGYDPELDDPSLDPVTAAAALGYDAYMLALDALATAGSTDKADVLAVMPSVAYNGITGRLSFRDSGDAARESIYVKRADYINGVWKQAKGASPKI